MAEYLLNRDLYIDQLLFPDNLTNPQAEPPGRMSLFTTISFVVITLGLQFALIKKYFTAQIVMILGLLLTYISFVGVLYNISGLFSFGPYSAIALPTTLGLISASLASLFYTSDKGWLSEMAYRHSAAITTRYSLFYFFLSVPVFIGLFLLMLSKARLPAELAIVILIVGFAALTLPFAFILLKKLNRSDERSLRLTEELKERSKQLHYNNEELARSNKELDSLIHIISHDLKTPIAGLQTSLDILERKLGPQLEEKELQLLAIPKRSVKRLNETIRRLSDIIKARQFQDIVKEKIDLCGLVDEIIPNCRF
ncbi:HAMP domain-containing histidine kinase [Mucilaginibacter pallidiroseus]|uniref:histidine kinase n=1 Tax=Mucilaginibacter pallidiroseus TaxID=2599295 RepID=A0A563UBT4_9SPHI|nr:histidine kinase dimerization/phospho-acceptor domain-containing protein [Mucilaginibacter pallidiroseus]TWR28831.1 HAMP domain-containing histidine kinase [Mucilaginibacter pallidiroseus]